MPGMRCAVAACSNSIRVSRRCSSTSHIKYHQFPTEPDRLKLWARLCRRQGKWNTKNCHICSVHFRPEDFERDLKAELLHLPLRRILKKTAVPSLLMKPYESNEIVVTKRTLRQETRARKKTVREILDEHKDDKKEDDYLLPLEQVFLIPKYDIVDESNWIGLNFIKDARISAVNVKQEQAEHDVSDCWKIKTEVLDEPSVEGGVLKASVVKTERMESSCVDTEMFDDKVTRVEHLSI